MIINQFHALFKRQVNFQGTCHIKKCFFFFCFVKALCPCTMFGIPTTTTTTTTTATTTAAIVTIRKAEVQEFCSGVCKSITLYSSECQVSCFFMEQNCVLCVSVSSFFQDCCVNKCLLDNVAAVTFDVNKHMRHFNFECVSSETPFSDTETFINSDGIHVNCLTV